MDNIMTEHFTRTALKRILRKVTLPDDSAFGFEKIFTFKYNENSRVQSIKQTRLECLTS